MRLPTFGALALLAVMTLSGCDYFEDYGLDMDSMFTIQTDEFWEDITPGRLERFLAKNPKAMYLKDDGDISPVAKAMNTNQPLVYLEIFSRHGVNLNIEADSWGLTPLHWAVREHKPIEVIDWLLEHGANPNIRDGSFGAFSETIAGHPNLQALDHMLNYATPQIICCGTGTLFRSTDDGEMTLLLLSHVKAENLSEWDVIALWTRIMAYGRSPDTEQLATEMTRVLMSSGLTLRDLVPDTYGLIQDLTHSMQSDAYLNFLLDQGLVIIHSNSELSSNMSLDWFSQETFERVCAMEKEAGLVGRYVTQCPYGEGINLPWNPARDKSCYFINR